MLEVRYNLERTILAPFFALRLLDCDVSDRRDLVEFWFVLLHFALASHGIAVKLDELALDGLELGFHDL